MARTPAARSAQFRTHEDLVALRTRVVDVAERRSAVERAPVDASETRERIAAHVESEHRAVLSAMHTDDFTRPEWSSSGFDLWTPMHVHAAPAIGVIGIQQSAPQAHPVGLMAVFFGVDVVVDRLCSLAAPKGAGGISAGERTAELARLDEEARDLGIVEERIIREAEGRGLSVPRRGDAEPAIVLALTLEGEAT